MKFVHTSIVLFCFLLQAKAQLTIEQIMADPKESVGTLPSNPFWSEDGKTLYFSWNPDRKTSDSLYAVVLPNLKPTKLTDEQRRNLPPQFGAYNRDKTRKLYAKNGDIYLLDCKTLVSRLLINTVESESNPVFNQKEDKVLFAKSNNLYSLHLGTGELTQLTNFQTGEAKSEPKISEQEKWLKQDQLSLFDILKERADKKKEGEGNTKTDAAKRPKEVFLGTKLIDNQSISADEGFVIYRMSQPAANEKRTIVPNYVTESGFTEDIPGRAKVGAIRGAQELWIYNIKKDTVLQVSTKNIEGINDKPDYLKDYPSKSDTAKDKKSEPRKVSFSNILWSADGKYAVVVLRSYDNKDRWIMQLNVESASLKLIDRQRDEAWIGGPINEIGFLGDNKTLYYQSEADGFAHLYTADLSTGKKTQLTKGKFEVQNVQLSKDKQFFYVTTNEVHFGEQHFYKMPINGGERVRLTARTGAHQTVLSPDETQLAYLYSGATQPWELYVQDNKPMAKPTQITYSLSKNFTSYNWREPKVITIKARDGVDVYARLYEGRGENGKKPAVIFVHGAGYLQNAHKWWSSYFREYMFHNFLVEQGYTVLDMDYRGSAGYGRDCRTGIYRFMGGKDLTDHVDGAKWLVDNQGVDKNRIGIYGGSYGGFMTLMALFTTPDVFKSGAALRPVTDWAAYNHPYTANILNEPQADSIAYRRSSPIYHAEGLKGHLLICHGMIDVNVHFQDAVRLTQRLIELKKDNWELAAYPLEDHGFVEPTSWLDEYKRIFKLFESTLKK
ncbi:MAG: prolyl oligopeptidase family serine peptidase [Saprospiraceae bacterium]|nr:prolyl oligopeptidase family serine peptidase [Saprospiraceae bacterium]